MGFVRLNISLPADLVDELNKEVKPRQKSRFIAQAIKYSLEESRTKKMAIEYQEAAAEIRRLNQEMEGTLSDGLD